MKYIQNPVEVDARQFKGDPTNGQELVAWINNVWPSASTYWSAGKSDPSHLMAKLMVVVPSNEAEVWTLYPGEWIVKFEDGFKFYGKSDFPNLFTKA